MDEITTTLQVNGTEVTVNAPGRTTLADLLRDRMQLTGAHLGCEQGVCGACTVFVDELPVRSCLTLAAACAGCQVVTPEALSGDDIDRLREEFSTEGGLQCGFCTPGMLVSAIDLIRRRQDFTRQEIAEAMSGNICRCTGYNGIVRAIQNANQAGIESESRASEETR